MRRYAILVTALIMVCFNFAVAADAPNFELKDVNGKKVSLSKLLKENKVVVVDFWQVKCKPCNELLPHLQDYADEYKKKGVAFVIISIDSSQQEAEVEPFFTSNKYTFPVLLDQDKEVGKAYGVKAAPATFIIKPNREMVLQHYGYKSGQEKEIKAMIDEVLAGK